MITRLLTRRSAVAVTLLGLVAAAFGQAERGRDQAEQRDGDGAAARE